MQSELGTRCWEALPKLFGFVHGCVGLLSKTGLWCCTPHAIHPLKAWETLRRVEPCRSCSGGRSTRRRSGRSTFPATALVAVGMPVAAWPMTTSASNSAPAPPPALTSSPAASALAAAAPKYALALQQVTCLALLMPALVKHCPASLGSYRATLTLESYVQCGLYALPSWHVARCCALNQEARSGILNLDCLSRASRSLACDLKCTTHACAP